MGFPGRAEPVPPSELLEPRSLPTEDSLPADDDLLNSTIPTWAQSVQDSVPLDDHPTEWGTRPYRDSPEPERPTWQIVSQLSKTFLDHLLGYTHAEAPEPAEDQSRGKVSPHH